MSTEIDVEMLIWEVEKRPALYNTEMKEYTDKMFREKLWNEVYEIVLLNWDQLTISERALKGKDVLSRWTNLRTCFKRELVAQKNDATGKSGRKRRKYIYFDQLLFLLPYVDTNKAESIYLPSLSTDNDIKVEVDEQQSTSMSKNILDNYQYHHSDYTLDKISVEIDVEILISEVEKRPALYNPELDEYADKALKDMVWTEVYKSVLSNWKNLTTIEKALKGKEVTNRWNNLRTCFKRELAAQKNDSVGKSGRKRRKYIYFDKLLFLLPYIDYNKTDSHNLPSPSTDTDAKDEYRLDIDEDERSRKPRNINIYKKKPKKSFEELLLQILEEKKDMDYEIDEDKYFLLSLYPAFKKFNDEQRFQARTEFLNVMRRVALSVNE